MPASPARRLACEILLAVGQEGGYAGDLLHARAGALSPADRRLATELVLGVLRWRGSLDYVIERAARRPAGKMPPLALTALRLGAYQLRYLTRVPANAAVHESVELAKPAGAKTAGFVNAVLRHLPRAPMAALLANDSDNARCREAEFSHPAWLLERWSRNFSPAAAAAMAEYDNQPPPTAFWPPQTIPGIESSPGLLLRSARRLLSGELTQSQAFRQGRIWIQDEASQLIAHLLQPRPNDTILDCCAAPGSKTARLLSLAPSRAGGRVDSPEARSRPKYGVPNEVPFRRRGKTSACRPSRPIPERPGGADQREAAGAQPPAKTGRACRLVALDRHLKRAALLARRLRRHGAGPVPVVVADATAPLPFTTRFDRILVDAPCTGTGTLARNPEIRWRLAPTDPARLAALQLQILHRSAAQLAPGGRMLYSVCSIEPEEGPQVIATLLQAHPDLRLLPMAELLAPLQAGGELLVPPAALCDGPWLRLLPGAWASDGFFAACIVPV